MNTRLSRAVIIWLVGILALGTAFGLLTDGSSFDAHHPFLIGFATNSLSIALSALVAALIIDRSRKREAAKLWRLKVWAVRPRFLLNLNCEMRFVYSSYSPWMGQLPEWFQPIKAAGASFFVQAREIVNRFDKQVGHKPNPNGNPDEIPFVWLLIFLPLLPFFMLGNWAFQNFEPLIKYSDRRRKREWEKFWASREKPPCAPEDVKYPEKRYITGAEILEGLGEAASQEVMAAARIVDVAYENWQKEVQLRIDRTLKNDFEREIEAAQVYEHSLKKVMDSLADLAPIQEFEYFS